MHLCVLPYQINKFGMNKFYYCQIMYLFLALIGALFSKGRPKNPTDVTFNVLTDHIPDGFLQEDIYKESETRRPPPHRARYHRTITTAHECEGVVRLCYFSNGESTICAATQRPQIRKARAQHETAAIVVCINVRAENY